MKFKVWDRRLEQMYEPEEVLVQFSGDDVIVIHKETLHQFNNCKLLLASGSKDDFGEECFDGDVVEDINSNERHIVEYEKGSFWMSNGNDIQLLSKYNGVLKILGNIHENRDLLQRIDVETKEMEKAVAYANKYHDGHMTLMKFSSNWRACFGTLDGDNLGLLRGQIQQCAVGETLNECLDELMETKINVDDMEEYDYIKDIIEKSRPNDI